jgi:hypothetical protein
VTPSGYALWVRVHGHLAVLGLALLLHPVITLARRRAATTWTRRSAWLAAALLAIPYGLGWWLYPTYRTRVKSRLIAAHDPIWLRFESKEHLALLTIALAISGAVALHAAGTSPEGRRTAAALLLAAFLCGITTAILGVAVSATAHPGW